MKSPLEGLVILDMTRFLSGPFCTMLLGDRGAEVIKVEPPEVGDDTRAWAPFIVGNLPLVFIPPPALEENTGEVLEKLEFSGEEVRHLFSEKIVS